MVQKRRRGGSIWARSARANISRLPGRTARISKGIVSGSYGWKDAKKDMVQPYNQFKAGSSGLKQITSGIRNLKITDVGTSNKSSNVQTVAGGQTEWTSRKFQLGKKLSKSQLALRAMKANIHKIVFRWQRIFSAQTEINGGGSLWMHNRVVGADTFRSMPLYAWDLTSVNQSTLSGAPCTALGFQTATGFATFRTIQGVGSDGVTLSNFWGTEQQPSSLLDTTMFPRTRDYMSWANIKLNLYGIKNGVTKYHVWLCQFKDRELCPDDETNLEYGGDTVVPNEKRTMFYQSLMKPLTFNPIATTNNLYKSRVKVLRKQTIVLSDQEVQSSDTDPLNKVLSWFVKVNRTCDYTGLATNIVNPLDVADQSDYTIQAGQQVSTRLPHRQRLYLMVFCTNYGLDTSDTTTHTPSIDANIRVCHLGFD